jgi:hypothetical protein
MYAASVLCLRLQRELLPSLLKTNLPWAVHLVYNPFLKLKRAANVVLFD